MVPGYFTEYRSTLTDIATEYRSTLTDIATLQLNTDQLSQTLQHFTASFKISVTYYDCQQLHTKTNDLAL
jgi:hypothetical protein